MWIEVTEGLKKKNILQTCAVKLTTFKTAFSKNLTISKYTDIKSNPQADSLLNHHFWNTCVSKHMKTSLISDFETCLKTVESSFK